jgi:hypothetical protein
MVSSRIAQLAQHGLLVGQTSLLHQEVPSRQVVIALDEVLDFADLKVSEDMHDGSLELTATVGKSA